MGSGLPKEAASVVLVGGGRASFCGSFSFSEGWGACRGASLKRRIGGMFVDVVERLRYLQ